MHKNYNGEVLYTIEFEKPEDIITGLPPQQKKEKQRNALTPGPMPVGAVIKPPLSDCKYTKKIITSKYFPGNFQKNHRKQHHYAAHQGR